MVLRAQLVASGRLGPHQPRAGRQQVGKPAAGNQVGKLPKPTNTQHKPFWRNWRLLPQLRPQMGCVN
jgi:hypothetical protein